MPRAEEEALAAATREDGSRDGEASQAAYVAALTQRREQLIQEARAVFRAVEGWSAIQDRDDWEREVLAADDGLESGGFLLDRLGAERYVDPQLTAVLLVLRRRLVQETSANTAAEYLLIDSIVLAYYHQIRINGWIGNFSALLEREFFGNGPTLTAKLQGHYGADTVRGLTVEDIVHRLGEELFPLLDRANRLMLRNLKALHALKLPAAPSVSIGQAGQVNVGQHQVNAVVPPAPMARPASDGTASS